MLSTKAGLDSYMSGMLHTPVSSFVAWETEILINRVNIKLTSSKLYDHNNILMFMCSPEGVHIYSYG